MDEAAGLQAFRERFLQGAVFEEHILEFLPLIASFLPASQRTQTNESRAAWRAYVATEAGAVHAQCLARREADPDAVITLEEARIIVGPLLDPTRTAPRLSGQRLAQFWAMLPPTDPDKLEMLAFFLALAARHPAFYEAVRLIASDQLKTGEPLDGVLRSWIGGALQGKKPKGPRGRPKETERDLRIFAAVLVLQHLGFSPTLDDGKDRTPSGCGIVADVLVLSYNAVATVWTDQRGRLRDIGRPP
ncbi:MAG: hypothetical protein OXG19_05000 [Chloroflexi bacterium]|nr:hypothetical protein [Chloroflexota bacterium]